MNNVSRPASAKGGAPAQGLARSSQRVAATAVPGGDFASRLQQTMQTAQAKPQAVAISAHAGARLDARGISVTPHMMERLAHGTDQLARKNARESLIVMGRVGFVMNVPNRTVVTAMPLQGAGAQVFTNIDSALWLDE